MIKDRLIRKILTFKTQTGRCQKKGGVLTRRLAYRTAAGTIPQRTAPQPTPTMSGSSSSPPVGGIRTFESFAQYFSSNPYYKVHSKDPANGKLVVEDVTGGYLISMVYPDVLNSINVMSGEGRALRVKNVAAPRASARIVESISKLLSIAKGKAPRMSRMIRLGVTAEYELGGVILENIGVSKPFTDLVNRAGEVRKRVEAASFSAPGNPHLEKLLKDMDAYMNMLSEVIPPVVQVGGECEFSQDEMEDLYDELAGLLDGMEVDLSKASVPRRKKSDLFLQDV